MSPNEIPTKAVVGVGGMGRGHLKNVNSAAKLVAVCDVDKGHLKTALERHSPAARIVPSERPALASSVALPARKAFREKSLAAGTPNITRHLRMTDVTSAGLHGHN